MGDMNPAGSQTGLPLLVFGMPKSNRKIRLQTSRSQWEWSGLRRRLVRTAPISGVRTTPRAKMSMLMR